MPINFNKPAAVPTGWMIADDLAADIEIPTPATLNAAGLNAAVDNWLYDPYIKAKMGTKPHPPMAPKTTLPPLELNIAAKKPDPFTKILSVNDAMDARMEGRQLSYIDKYMKGAKTILSPATKVAKNDWPYLIHECGLYVHNTIHVKVYVPVMDMLEGRIYMWTGLCIDEWQGDPECKILQPFSFVSIEEGVVCDF
jgi:hypothetical protein